MQTPRWAGILSRTAAAVLGGYGLASLVAACCALGLGPPRSEAVLTGMLLSYAVHACAAVYAFAACSAWRAWGGIALPSALLGAWLWRLLAQGATGGAA